MEDLFTSLFCAISSFLLLSGSFAADSIASNQGIKDGETIVSTEEMYELGFFSPANSKDRYLGLWFKKISKGRVVWVANRDDPFSFFGVNCLIVKHPYPLPHYQRKCMWWEYQPANDDANFVQPKAMGSGLHLQNTHNFTRFSPIVSLSGNFKTLPWCCFTTKLYFNGTHTRRLKLYERRLTQLTSVKSQADDPTIISTHEHELPKATLLWRAIKLPIYSVALVPLTVGTAAAYLQTGVFSSKQYGLLLASSILIITWLNLSNDVYDFDTGADLNKKESVVNMIGSRSLTLTTALAFLGLGCIGLVWASMEAGNIRSILLLASAITCGYIYQCPPFRLSYRGLGEPLCFAAFGPFATTAFYLLQSSRSTTKLKMLPITNTILSASVLVGITTSLILFCSHFHQIDDDKAVGKLSPLVRIGTETGSNVVKVAVISLYSLLVLSGICRALPFTSIFLCAVTVPMGKVVVSFIADNHRDKTKIFMGKYFCVRLHALFGVALSVGMVAARILTRNNVPQPVFT